MHSGSCHTLRRILVVDDCLAIHDDFRKIFNVASPGTLAIELTEQLVFGTELAPATGVGFDVAFAEQGQEALQAVRDALEEGRPFEMAFVDVRMPPGWDGVETISRIWAEYPDLQVVLCTAYSDYSWMQLMEKLGYSDRLVILKKPFDNIEVMQLAHSLTMKWQTQQLARRQWKELESRIDERTSELEQAYCQLHQKSSPAPGAGVVVTSESTF